MPISAARRWTGSIASTGCGAHASAPGLAPLAPGRAAILDRQSGRHRCRPGCPEPGRASLITSSREAARGSPATLRHHHRRLHAAPGRRRYRDPQRATVDGIILTVHPGWSIAATPLRPHNCSGTWVRQSSVPLSMVWTRERAATDIVRAPPGIVPTPPRSRPATTTRPRGLRNGGSTVSTVSLTSARDRHSAMPRKAPPAIRRLCPTRLRVTSSQESTLTRLPPSP